MAKKEKEEIRTDGWKDTFSDLMNLLLCFFVLLYSMSNVDQVKYAELVASLSNSFSIFTGGEKAVGDGQLVSSGASQLNNLDEYYSDMGKAKESQKEEDPMSELEKQQKEENERLAEKKKNDSERALKNQIYKNKIELARTRIKRMHGYLYQPSNMQLLIDSAKEALDACKGYSEYYNLKAMFDMYKKELEELPVKGESNKKNQTPTDTSEPVATEEPQEEE